MSASQIMVPQGMGRASHLIYQELLFSLVFHVLYCKRYISPARRPIIVRLYLRMVMPIYFQIIFSVLVALWATNASAIPMGDAYDTDHDVQASPEFHPRNGVPPAFHPSLYPNLNNEINEAHPIPDYINKFSKGQSFPFYYQQLLEIDPKNQVQSKIFNEQAFRSIRRISILGFENKTAGPFKDDNAGNVLARQVSQELQSVKNYFIIPPPLTNEDARLRIVAEPPYDKNNQVKSSNSETQPTLNLPQSGDKMDAVMIGAVTKYINSYQTRNGNIEKSLSSSIEFGAFLVSTLTGDVVWGARFIGSQPTGLSRFLLNSGPSWMSKEQLSQGAMKDVLKAFHENKLR